MGCAALVAQYVRKSILSREDTSHIMEEATSLTQGCKYEVTSAHVLRLVLQSACSAYDCECIALAQDLKIPLVTLDKQLLKEFPNDTIS